MVVDALVPEATGSMSSSPSTNRIALYACVKPEYLLIKLSSRALCGLASPKHGLS